ncbi:MULTISPECIES: hypothetical protein [unclassified Acidovorax]|uniref:hypothetical protein n=1 Tax=unclassified Acidovorax TaxID=2684926 RepID=UPI000B16BCC8|nr:MULTISPECIES: hypothetical protein [unclassified Acidovorax]
MTTLKKIAFTSCMSTEVFSARQPVWEDIGWHKPDVLVLLGDSIYIDCPWPKGPDGMVTEPALLNPSDFAAHVHRLYRKQLAVPEFRTLLQQDGLATYAIWDDHDFLWNDARQQQALSHLEHAVYSSNLFQCWRDALAGVAPFPVTAMDPRVLKNIGVPRGQVRFNDAMPGYRCEVLFAGLVVLHLTDGRSWRDGPTLLGTQQKAMMQARMADHPNALHLVASGSTINGWEINGWKHYPEDLRWLLALAETYDVRVLSGDIHEIDRKATWTEKGGRQLHEYIASGAAVDFAPPLLAGFFPANIPVTAQRQFGLITLEDGLLPNVQFFKDGRRQGDISDPVPGA